jgi:hypothetical protein
LNFETTVSYRDIEFEVSGEYAPPIPGIAYLSNGDPGYPGEGDFFEEFDIRIGGASIYELLTLGAAEDIESLALDMAREEAGGERSKSWA